MINVTAYAFSLHGGLYSQYPDDTGSQIFKSFLGDKEAQSKIVVHRDGALMYYGYTLCLDEDGREQIGFCLIVNDIRFVSIKGLFQLFESEVSMLIREDVILKVKEDGSVVCYMGAEEALDALLGRLSDAASRQRTAALPPVDYSVSSEQSKYFTSTDAPQSISKASTTYGYTYVYKDNALDAILLARERGISKMLRMNLERLAEAIEKLTSENKALKRAKRQMGVVIWLVVILILSAVAYAMASRSLNESQRQVALMGQNNYELRTQNQSLTESASSLSKRFTTLQRQHKMKVDSLDNLLSSTRRAYEDLEDKHKKECNEYAERETDLRTKLKALEIGNADLRSKNSSLSSQLSDLKKSSSSASAIPIDIVGCQIAGYDRNKKLVSYFDEPIKGRIYYIWPRITYNCSSNPFDIYLTAKLFARNANGGFNLVNSSTSYISLKKGLGFTADLKMLGYAGGSLVSGQYRLELRYNDNLCFFTTFQIL